jgi:hypothetical protein
MPLDEFLSEHVAYPWPYAHGEIGDAYIRQLHKAYKAWAIERGEPWLSEDEFTPAVVAAGYEKQKIGSGTIFIGLMPTSRADTAREDVIDDLMCSILFARSGETLEEKLVLAEAAVAQAVEDGTVDRRVERHYGPFLRWRIGDQSVIDQR